MCKPWVILGEKFRSWAKLGGLKFWLGELFRWSGLRDLQIYSPKFIFKKLYIKPLAHGYLREKSMEIHFRPLKFELDPPICPDFLVKAMIQRYFTPIF